MHLCYAVASHALFICLLCWYMQRNAKLLISDVPPTCWCCILGAHQLSCCKASLLPAGVPLAVQT